MSNLIRGISENGGVVFCGVDSTEIVRTAEKLHTTSATCSAALGRLLTGVSLMGAMLKDDGDSITLRVSGGGQAGVVIACTDAHGNVKGCIDHPLVELPAKENGHLDVGGAGGKDGVLTVIRDNKLQKEPTVGQVPLVSGGIRMIHAKPKHMKKPLHYRNISHFFFHCHMHRNPVSGKYLFQ